MALTDGLISYYKLDEASGTVIDELGTNNGTNSGATAGVTGILGTCYDFESTETDFISLDTAQVVTSQSSWSIWLKPESDPATFYIFLAKDVEATRSWNIGLSRIGSENFVAFQWGLTQSTADNGNVTAGAWHHIVVTFNDTTNAVEMYLDGDSVYSTTNVGTASTGSSKIFIGKREYTSSKLPYDGLIDEVGIWSRVLSPTEVTSLYNGGNGFAYPFTTPPTSDNNVANMKINIDSVDYFDVLQVNVDKSMNDFNTTSSFTAEFSNYAGEHSTAFNLNDEVIVYVDYNTDSPTTKIFKGIIESIKFNGRGLDETITLSGRDYGAVLQDIIVSPRVFKNQEVSSIVSALITQNANGTGITMANVNATTTTIDKITFNNISLFDAIKQLAEIAGFYFYIDEDKDLHFEEKNSVSSGYTLNNTNVMHSNFDTTDSDIFNNVYVYGNRQLTGVREIFGPGEQTNGSVYILDDKPSNIVVMGSATAPSKYVQPGGILYVNDPADDNVKWLMDYDQKKVILTSGTNAGDNTGWTGSGVIIDYQRSSILVSVKQDLASQATYGIKDKRLIDKNIRTLAEANIRATSYLDEHKNPTIYGEVKTRRILNVTPGNTVFVNIPFHNISNQTYAVIKASYTFTKKTCLSDTFLCLSLNKKVRNFLDLMKEQELRLRAIEGSDVETSISNITIGTGSVSVESSGCKVIQRIIGSAFYFNVFNHNILNSPTSVLGDARLGSIVK